MDKAIFVLMPTRFERSRSTLRLASRRSPLALCQASLVAERLSRVLSEVEIEVVPVHTRGDTLIDVALDRIGGRGVFVTEVQGALLRGEADVAVHSAKDLPSGTIDGLRVGAVLERGDPRDALVGMCLSELPSGAVIATGSARRRAQLANLRPDLTFADLRGNMARRVEAAGSGAHCVVVAAAAMSRLGWNDRVAEILPTTVLLPQVGQGTIAVECRADDFVTAELLAEIDDRDSRITLSAERAFLDQVSGSCSLPLAALATVDRRGEITLDAMLLSGDGRVMVKISKRGSDPVSLGAEAGNYAIDECGAQAIDGFDVGLPGVRK